MAEEVPTKHAAPKKKPEELLEKSLHELKRLDQVESSLIVTGWLTSAAHDRNPQHSLDDLFKAISRSAAEQLLDALSALPILVPCADQSAEDILSLVAECTSAKEVMIACQEAMEHLHVSLNNYKSEGDHTSNGAPLSPALQLRRILFIYSAALARLTLRRKGSAETLGLLFGELDATLLLISQHATVDECRELAHALAQLFIAAASWSKDRSGAESDLVQCKAHLRTSYEKTITCIAPLLQANLAQRTFMDAYPRLTRQSSLDPIWKGGADALTSLVDASDSLGLSAESYISAPSVTALIYLGSLPQRRKPAYLTLPKLVPVAMRCLQSNMALDVTLSYLCSELTAPAKPSLDAEVAFNLAYTIALVSASHPDPTIRLITFRLLSLCLPLLPPPQRLNFLSDILAPAPETPPQLRVAAVSLARDAVLHALAEPSPSLLASPHMLRSLAPTLFRTEPLDLFQDLSTFDAHSFLQSMEPKRLTECLSFYYVVWARDISNKIGLRDRDNVENIEKSLFRPLRAALENMSASDAARYHEHECTLAGLQIGLERIADAVQPKHTKSGKA